MSATAGRWQRILDDGRVECRLCPRYCRLADGKRGFCFTRINDGGRIVQTGYGRSTGFCIDPIEKKPLNHFLPGTSVLSLGGAGCNLGCKFCQNWDTSKAREMERLTDEAPPGAIAAAAAEHGCDSVAFTYNDPVTWAEYALDIAAACRAAGIRTVAVSAGYITGEARPEFFSGMDAANIDLKAFTERFYRKVCLAELGPVLDTLRYLRHETDTWLEITTLLVPGENDSDAELHALSEWIAGELGPDVPLHFTAFHPDYKMRDKERTPVATCRRARSIALSKGLRFVYTGNVHDPASGSTFCPSCGECVIQRDWYELGAYHMRGAECARCGARIPGVFGAGHGNWGRRRQMVQINPAAGR